LSIGRLIGSTGAIGSTGTDWFETDNELDFVEILSTKQPKTGRGRFGARRHSRAI